MNKYNEFLSNLSSSVIVSFYISFTSIICSSILFANSNSSLISSSLSIIVFGSVISNFFYYLKSDNPFITSCGSPFLCLILSEIISKVLKTSDNIQSEIPTILAIFLISGIMASLLMYIVGKLKLGHLIRFLPLPVVGGLILGFGIFIIIDSYNVINNNVPDKFKNYLIPIILISFVFILSVIFLNLKFKSKSYIVFFLLAVIFSINLIRYFMPDSDFINSLFFESSKKFEFKMDKVNVYNMIFLVDYHSIYKNIHLLIVFGILSVIQYLSINLVIETQFNEKQDVDSQIKLTSKINGLTSVFFSPVLIPSAGIVSMTYLLSPSKKYFTLIVSLLLTLFLLFSETILYSIPYFFIASMPVLIGLQIVNEWLFSSFKSMPRSEYAIIIIISLAFIVFGSVQSAIIGVAVSSLFFIVKYSKTKTIRYHMTGKLYKSNFVRPSKQISYLNKNGHKIHIYKLQGYLFFGSTKILAEKISKSLEIDSEIRYIIIDFSFVTSIDISGINFLIQLHKNAEKNNVEILITSSSDEIKKIIINKDKNYDIGSAFFNSFDEGLERCEDCLLKDAPDSVRNIESNDYISSLIESNKDYIIFKKYLIEKNIKKGGFVFRKGDESNSIAFVKKGLIGVYINSGEKKERVMKSGYGTIIGDIGFFLNVPRTADVIAETDVDIFYLTMDSYKSLCDEYPKISLLFSNEIIKQQAKNINKTNEKVNMLL